MSDELTPRDPEWAYGYGCPCWIDEKPQRMTGRKWRRIERRRKRLQKQDRLTILMVGKLTLSDELVQAGDGLWACAGTITFGEVENE
jgi:hypothetical protein